MKLTNFHIKNIIRHSISFILHFLCILLFFISFFYFSKFIYSDVNVNYSNYKLLRSVQNYGLETIANLQSQTDNVAIYSYVVDDIKYEFSLVKLKDMNVEKELKIFYDILEPNLAIDNTFIENNKNFYVETLRTLGYFYLIILVMVLVTGCLWYLIDRMKYSRYIWKESLYGVFI